MNAAASEALTMDGPDDFERELPPEHQRIEARARAYTHETFEWLRMNDAYAAADPSDPFVRPGLDEPEEMAKLLASEAG
jgi:hypothetical protein